MKDVRDMTDLVYVYDAYMAINKALFGDAMLLGFHEGNFGTISRICNVIQRNVAEKLKKDECESAWRILDNVSLTPEERARRLLGK